MPERIELMGVAMDPVTEDEAVRFILDETAAGRGGSVVTPNLDILRRLVREPELREEVAAADLMLADGMPLVWACRVQGTPLPGRVAGSDMILSLSEAAARDGAAVYLLGGTPGTADAAAAELEARYPGLDVVGTNCPPIGFEDDPVRMAAIGEEIERLRPDIVLLGLPFPKTFLVGTRLREHRPSAWFVGIGISFSFVTGEVRRAPELVQRLGLEWVHRLAQEPRRLARRYLVDDLPFAARLGAHAVRRRLARPRRSRPS
ncbi:MAG: WecB/TagA/CpsF family glycosyltransferase [Thermoleophilia bacterium]